MAFVINPQLVFGVPALERGRVLLLPIGGSLGLGFSLGLILGQAPSDQSFN